MNANQQRITAKTGPFPDDSMVIWEWVLCDSCVIELVITSLNGTGRQGYYVTALKKNPWPTGFYSASIRSAHDCVAEINFLVPDEVIDAAPESIRGLLNKAP